MSQSQTASSTGRTALALGVVALIIGASALGYAVYLGLSQLPSELSAATVNVPCSTSQPYADKTIRIDWTLDDSGQDRFNPQYITVIQGDNLTIIFNTNDTTDAHTFTINLGLRGFSSSTFFQLNNSWTGLSSGDFITPGTPGYNLNFTGKPDGCQDNNGSTVACNTQKQDDTANGGTGSTVSTTRKEAWSVTSQCFQTRDSLPNPLIQFFLTLFRIIYRRGRREEPYRSVL